MSPTRSAAAPEVTAPVDAIALVKADPASVSDLFAGYEKTRSNPQSKSLVSDICAVLSAHAQIEGITPYG